MTSPYLELPLRTEAEALAERIFDAKYRFPNGPSFSDAMECLRYLAMSEARAALAKEQRA